MLKDALIYGLYQEKRACDKRDQRQAGYGGEKEKATSPFSLPDRARRPPASIAPTDREPGIQPLVLF